MTPVQKRALFKVWDNFSPSYDTSKWIGVNFKTLEEYYNTLCEYYDIEGGVVGLKQSIIDDVNQYLSDKENHICSGGTIRMYNIDLEKDMSSTYGMQSRYLGMYSKPFAYFAYTEGPGYECSEEDLDYFKYEENPEEICYSENCITPVIRIASDIIRKKYGIMTNSDYADEKYVKGVIKIQKYK